MYKTLIQALFWSALLAPPALADIGIERRYAEPPHTARPDAPPLATERARIEHHRLQHRPWPGATTDRNERLRKRQARLYERQRRRMTHLYERQRQRAEQQRRRTLGLRPAPPRHGFRTPGHGFQTPPHGLPMPHPGFQSAPRDERRFERHRSQRHHPQRHRPRRLSPYESERHRRAPQTFFSR